MKNILELFSAIKEAELTGEPSWRKDVLNDKFDGVIVDTCCSPDCGWETGIANKTSDGHFIIAEEYPNREKAVEGHKKWTKIMKKNPKLKVEECRDAGGWFFGGD